MIVMKFGGTSVESQQAVARVTALSSSYRARHPVVVVSAMGKTTNKLLAAATEAAAGRRDQALTIIDELRGHHLIHGLALAGAAAADLDRYIRTHFEWLDELVKGLSVVGELSPALHGRHRQRGRAPLQPGRQLRFPRRRDTQPSTSTPAASSSQTIASPKPQPLFDETYNRLARRSRVRRRRHPSSSWAVSSAQPKTATPPLWAAAAPTTRPPSSGPASTPKKFKSGPTSTACSPPTRASSPAATA